MTSTRDSQPWIKRIKSFSRRKKRAYKQCNHSSRYKKLKQLAQKEKREAYNKYINIFCDNFKDNPRKFWSFIKRNEMRLMGHISTQTQRYYPHQSNSQNQHTQTAVCLSVLRYRFKWFPWHGPYPASRPTQIRHSTRRSTQTNRWSLHLQSQRTGQHQNASAQRTLCHHIRSPVASISSLLTSGLYTRRLAQSKYIHNLQKGW